MAQHIEPGALREPSVSVPLETEEDEFPESLPGFDLSAGLQRLQGNQRLYRKLLLDFGAKYANVAGAIRGALEAEDFEQAHHLVHDLKGLAGNLAATDLRTATVELEQLVKGEPAKGSSREELELRFSGLERNLKLALQSAHSLGLSAEDAAVAAAGEKITDIPADLAKEVAGRLREAAEAGDIAGLTSIGEELTAQSDSCAPLGKRIMGLAEDFDLDGALELAAELVGQEGVRE
jgi:HPt (histidine-containing phosphotransfer) domain-containing protein